MRPTAPATHRATPHRAAAGARVRAAVRDADGMAVASFVLGLLGLLVLNVVLGPIAIALAATALRRGTTRRGRACLGLGLGVADLLVLLALMRMNDTISWNL
ncbi:hypothetical protein [Streptomyces prasinopilosus]|uniref:DUF4190 domain-containing protein n=1 Tax=Streptomyces prasinopilosus TaxID=67344 RepID=A0A1G7AY78_9ACTN|nr:hypothetical protein SAMN05216505_12030 [Streptomyces prasinopilosus]